MDGRHAGHYRDGVAVACPNLHQQDAFFQQVAPAIRRLDLIRQAVRQRMLADFARKRVRNRLRAPVAEG